MRYFAEQPEKYRWIIVFAGGCGLFASLGIGRFALGMLLPSMGEALGLTYSEMGFIGTLNFCGYLFAVLLCGVFSVFLGARLLITLALFLVGGSMLLIGFVENLFLIMTLYCLTGIGSALSNVPIMALIASWFPPSYRGRAAGLVVVGNGFGLIVSGSLVPALNSGHEWQLGWIVLGLIAICAAFVCWGLVRNSPADFVGGTIGKSGNSQDPQGVGTRPSESRFRPIFLHCAAIYFLFGFTYVIYVTFFVTSLVQERGFSEHEAGLLWSWVGVLSLGSGPVFGYLSDRYGRKAGLMTVFSIQTAAYAMAASFFPASFIYLSVFCFGIVAWSVPSIMAALVGDVAGSQRTAAIFGFVTFVFGIGQIVGPFSAGILAEMRGGFAISFTVAALLTSSAVLLSAFLPRNTKKR